MIHSYYTTTNGKVVHDTEFTHVEWLHLSNPTSDEINRVVKHFGFPKDYLWINMHYFLQILFEVI